MKKNMLAGPTRALLLAACLAALFVGVLSLPWQVEVTPGPPRLEQRAAGIGPLLAGAADVLFDLPSNTPIAGFPRFDWKSVPPNGPVGARALALEAGGVRVAVVSAELLLVPGPLEADVRARLQDLNLDGMVIAATHTHASPGGFWDDTLAETIGTGPYRADVKRRIEDAIERSVRNAVLALAPVRLGFTVVDASALVSNRDGGPKDGRLSILRFERPDGSPVADLSVFGAHATLLGRGNRAIDGDWPGRFMAERPNGLRLLLQGTIGDQSASLPGVRADPKTYARAVSSLVEKADLKFTKDVSISLAYARVLVALPELTPGALPAFLWPAARTLLRGAVPKVAPVSAIRIGPVLLVAFPGEPVAEVAMEWRNRPGLGGATFVSLADAYLGYVETPAHFLERRGESVRDYLGPTFAETLGEGAESAVASLSR